MLYWYDNLYLFRRVVPVILEDSTESLSALDSALQDRTAQDWVSSSNFIDISAPKIAFIPRPVIWFFILPIPPPTGEGGGGA
jgi:hypothetical protein